MPTEHEELRLSVTLDDKASAQLGRLQAALNNVGIQASRIEEIKLDFRGLSARELGRDVGFIAGVVGGMTSELTKMGLEFIKQATDLPRYARNMVELSVAAQRSSQTIAQLKVNLKDFQRAGVSLESANRQLQKFADTIGNLQRENSNIGQRLLTGLRGNDFEKMQRFIQTMRTSDRATALREAKDYSEQIRAYWTRLGQAERGAAAQKEFLGILGVPDLDALDREVRRASKWSEELNKSREKDAKAYNDAVNDTKEAFDDIGQSIGNIVLNMPGVSQSMSLAAGFSEGIAKGMMQLEKSMRNAYSPEDIAESERQRKTVETPGQTGPLTDQERGTTAQEGMTQDQIDRLKRRYRRGAAPMGRPGSGGSASYLLGDGSGIGGDGPGGTVRMGAGGAVDRLPEEYEAIGGAMIEDRRGDVDVGNVPGSRPGAAASDNPMVDNTTGLEAFAYELRRLNDFLAPFNIMNPAFHNAPQGGAEGESNPMELTPNIGQPGGGAAAEARHPPGYRPNLGNKGTAPAAYGPYTTTAPDDKRQAAVRYNNPAAAMPASTGRHLLYGSTGYAQLQDKPKNLIARFTDPTLGAAYNFATFADVYAGKTVRQASEKWSQNIRHGTAGYDPNQVITPEMIRDPNFAVPFMMAMAGEEAAKLGITKEQMRQAHDVFSAGGVTNYANQAIDRMVEKPDAFDTAQLDPELRGGAIDVASADGEIASKKGKSTQQQAQDALADVRRSLKEQEEGRDPRRVQRALEGVAPDSDEEWELRRQQALKSDAGYFGNEKTKGFFSQENMNPQVPEGYGPGSGLPGMSEIEKTIESGGRRSGKTDEDVRKSEEYYSEPDWMTKGRRLGIEQRSSLERGDQSGGGPGSELPAGSYQEAKLRDKGKAGRASDAAQDWLGEGAAPREREDRISSLDRDVLDGAAGSNVQVDTSGMLSVNVDAPEGTTVKAEGSGVLEKTELNRQMAMNEA